MYNQYKVPIILIVGIWEIIWKSQALWKSAQKEQKIWFICILIFNTLGLLPIIYLLINKYNKKNTILNEIR